MNKLPKDIIAIVHRYVFDDIYRRLRIDYELTYLNKHHMVGDHFIGIFWSDVDQYFMCWNGYYGHVAANWRWIGEHHNEYKYIKKIWGTDRIVPLPANYF